MRYALREQIHRVHHHIFGVLIIVIGWMQHDDQRTPTGTVGVANDRQVGTIPSYDDNQLDIIMVIGYFYHIHGKLQFRRVALLGSRYKAWLNAL